MLMHARTAMIRKLSAAAANVQSVFDPLNKSANAVLSVGNTVLNSNDPSVANSRTTTPNSSGKHHLAMQLVTSSSAGSAIELTGLDNWSLQNSGTGPYALIHAGSTAGFIPDQSPATGDILHVAYDADAGEIFLGLNSTYYAFSGPSVVTAGSVPTTPTFTTTPGSELYVTGYAGSFDNLTILAPTPPPGWLSWG